MCWSGAVEDVKNIFVIYGALSFLDMCTLFFAFVDAVADVFSYLGKGGYKWCSGGCFVIFFNFLLIFSFILAE